MVATGLRAGGCYLRERMGLGEIWLLWVAAAWKNVRMLPMSFASNMTNQMKLSQPQDAGENLIHVQITRKSSLHFTAGGGGGPSTLSLSFSFFLRAKQTEHVHVSTPWETRFDQIGAGPPH